MDASLKSSSIPRRVPWYRWLAFFGLASLVPLGMLLYVINLDNWGTFSVTASIVDVDSDGDLDVIAHNVRKESDNTAFGGPRVWINDGTGKLALREFTPDGGWDSAAADVDQDGDPDLIVYLGYNLRIDLNQ